MKKLVFASKNKGKVKEVRRILSDANLQIFSLSEIGFVGEIEETGDTFEENAKLKARFVFNEYKLPVIADDSGLSVEHLNGQPGVKSARFAGIKSTDEENNLKLLKCLEKYPQPYKAKFICFAVYYFGTEIFTGIGEVSGEILKLPRGKNGFGYDPLFVPDGYNRTMAELSPESKNKISHRFKAFDQLKKYILEQ
jgi:XTP/dITP diphosphohydrolase